MLIFLRGRGAQSVLTEQGMVYRGTGPDGCIPMRKKYNTKVIILGMLDVRMNYIIIFPVFQINGAITSSNKSREHASLISAPLIAPNF